jgi:anthranilate synthase component 1
MWLQAGAGLVEASVPEKEYEETVNKARAGLVAVQAGAPEQ